MKKIIMVSLTLFVSSLASVVSAEENASLPGCTVNQLVEKYKTVEGISGWIENNIEYKSDHEVWNMQDYWQTSEETLKTRSGDCEDISILAYECFCKLGLEAKLVTINTKKRGHTICVFKRNGLWSYFSSDGLQDDRTNTYKELLGYAKIGWTYYAEVDTKGNTIFS